MNRLADSPVGIEFPIGHLEFTVQNVSVGNSTTVTLYLPDDSLVNTYYKYGPTSGDPTSHWYEFLFDGTTGAEIFAGPDADTDPEIIILHFVDGQRGDADLSANGQVHDPGSPAFRPNRPPVLDTLSATGVYENGTVHLTGMYHDPDAQDTHTLTIYWGEGAPQTVPVINGSFDITHQYLDDNPTNTGSDVYTIDVTLTDDTGPTPNLLHLYQFNGNMDDSVGNIPLINNGGTLNPTSLSFGPNQGPTLIAEAGLAESYSIAMRVALSDAYYYRKVIDFSNLASDNGQYFSQNTLDDPQSYLEFFPFLIGPTTFDYDATVEVVFSRDGNSGRFTMYLNGLAEGSFIDSDGDAIATLMGSNSIFSLLPG